ncbi:MAG: hypothetical protein V1799_08800 [bacterium]
MIDQIPHATPRTIRTKKKWGRGLIFVRIFILPHTIVGIGAILYALFITSMILIG